MTKEATNHWKEASTKLNYLPSHSVKKYEYLERNIDTIKGLKAEDIDNIDVQPSSVILRMSKGSPKKLGEALDGWKQNNELNEIFYRVAGEANPQSIANTLTGLSQVRNKEYLNSFYDALEGCSRTEDFVANANKEELYHSRKALSKLDREDVRNTINSINAKESENAATTIQSAFRGAKDRSYTNLVRKSYDELNGKGGTLNIPQNGEEKRAFDHALKLCRSSNQNFR